MDKINKTGYKIWIPSLFYKLQNFILFTSIFTLFLALVSSVEFYSEGSITYLFNMSVIFARSGIVISLYAIALYIFSPGTKFSRKIYRLLFLIISIVIYLVIIFITEIKVKIEGGNL